MFRASRARMSTVRPEQLAITLLACLFMLSIDGLMPQPADASGRSTSQMAALRPSQHRAAASMQRVDRKIKSLLRAKKQSRDRADAAASKLKKVAKRQARVEKRLAAALDRFDVAAVDRDRKLRVRPNPLGTQIADRPKLRKHVNKLESAAKGIDRKLGRLEAKERRAKAVVRGRAKAVGRIKTRVAVKIEKRERIEDVLGASIKRMVELAQASAATYTSSRPARTGFRRPAKGYISQGYGRHHDGIDIATPRGARVRASATGYVAYVGWNPWDEGKRAYVVIIGHAGGYETVYGHLLPIRVVRAGQRVSQGQTIGRAGSTGHSTGPHVHWEVSRGFRTMNPASVGR